MYRYGNGVFRISVRQLVEFIFRSGDLDNRSSGRESKKAMAEGTRIHKKIQKSMGGAYQSEVPMKMEIPVWIDKDWEEKVEAPSPDYKLLIEGRADGVFVYENDGKETLAIDEIKGIYQNVLLLNEPFPVHLAQAMCYGYDQSLKNGQCEICIQMTYVNLSTEDVKRFWHYYSFEELQKWFFELIEKYEMWCNFWFLHRKERNETAGNLPFPFVYRDGQRKLVAASYRTLEQGKRLFIQASTGIGKTMSVLFPAVRMFGLEKTEKIFYLTAKSITRAACSEAVSILEKKGLTVSSLVLTAKEKMCLAETMECNPTACIYAKGHLDRVNDAVYELITSKKHIGREDILEIAEKHKVCPFELSLDVSYWVDLVICDYNYAFDPNVKLQRYFSEGTGCDCLFLVDEAHNLVDRAREMYSASIYKEDFLAAKRLLEKIRPSLSKQIGKVNKILLGMKRECETIKKYEGISEIYPLVREMEKLYDECMEFAEQVPGYREPLYTDFFFEVRDFVMRSEDAEYGYQIYGKMDSEKGFFVKLFCVDPSWQLNACMENGNGSVLFSATMLPIQYYKKLLGNPEEDYAVYAASPFEKKNRLILVGRDVSTKYTRRNETEYRKVASYIDKLVKERVGNYMVFFPSYAYMEQVKSYLDEMGDCEYLEQKSRMDESEREQFLKEFCRTDRTLVGLCVMGGIFSEGIDLRGESLIGVVVVGTGLPQVGEERNLLKEYFDGQNMDGFSYAYLYPGLNKVLQSAGRLIRTDTDRGIILLLDDRFFRKEYMEQLPVEWEDLEATTLGQISSQAAKFWKKDEE